MLVEKIPFKIQALLGSLDLSQESFDQLKEGDVLVLEQTIGSPLSVIVDQKPQFYARPGIYKGKKAVKITRP